MKSFNILLIADEIVIDEEDPAAQSQAVDLVEFGQHLIRGFGAGRRP